jgi:hypothetical protein
MPKEVLGMGNYPERGDVPPDARAWLDQAERTDAVFVGASLAVVEVAGERRPEVHVAFSLPCICPKDCGGETPVVFELQLEDGVRLKDTLEALLEDPEALKATADCIHGSPPEEG